MERSFEDLLKEMPSIESYVDELWGGYITEIPLGLARTSGLTLIFVESGSIEVVVNGTISGVVKERGLLTLLSASQVEFVGSSEGLRASVLYAHKEFLTDITLGKRAFPLEFFSKLVESPIFNLRRDRASIISKRLGDIIDNINMGNHLFHRQMLLCYMAMFLMDAGNIVSRRAGVISSDTSVTRTDDITFRFLELLERYGKVKHPVSFYSDKLCITTQYLSKQVKLKSKNTAHWHISRLLINEAKMLLRVDRLSVQEISERLGFSDQAAFGKFFKLHVGESPMAYRKGW